MYSKTASKRYAKALIGSAIDSNILEETYSEINSLKDTLTSSIELSEYLLNPTISKDEKGSFIIKIVGNEHPHLINLINLLKANNRLDELENIADSFNELYAKRKGIIEASITSAVPISIDLENEIVNYLKSIKKGQINLTKKIDKSIIAGFVLDFDDTQFDASAKKKLNKMQKQLTQNN
ncbi:MAG TPA: ATP synthase F1 subunit delta [Flavobacteriaceae bacterium]|nr:ATP synthase F1 subunit delta [Flavobacteriaceae bacterium]